MSAHLPGVVRTLVDIPGALVDTVGPTRHGMVSLRLLTVDREVRGRGVGQAALSALCGCADEHGWTVRLAATDNLGSDVRRLVRWYARHGFVPDRAGTPMWPDHVPMVRIPRGSTP